MSTSAGAGAGGTSTTAPAAGHGVASRVGAGLTTRGQSFVASGGMLLVCGYLLGLGDVVRLGLLLLGLVAAAVLLARRCPAGLHTERVVSPAALQADEPASVLLTVRNDGSRRTPTLVGTELLPLVLGDRPRLVLPPLAPGEERVVRYPVRPRARGEVVLGPLVLDVQDGFGLTARRLATGAGHAVLVHPRVVDLGGAAPPGAVADGTGGSSVGLSAGSSPDLGVRPYRTGDEQRRIHWKASAHAGSLMVRQDERPVRRRAVVLLDSRAGAHGGRGEGSTFEWAVTAAASVVDHLAGLGLEVALVTDATVEALGREAARTRPDRPADPAHDARSVLARAATGDRDAFARCVQTAGDLATAGGLLVAVLGVDPADQDLLAATRHPATRALALVVHEPGRTEAARELESELARRGWRTTAATPATDVAAAWAAVTGRGAA